MLFVGCTYTQNTMKETKKMYKKYVLPGASVDLDASSLSEDSQLRLAALMKPVDWPIFELYRYLDGKDSKPDEEWFQILFTRFNWLSGVMVVDTTGNTVFKYPSVSLKTYNVQALVDFGEAWKDHKVRSFAEVNELGPEVYMASPLFEDSEFKGLLIVHFDPRKLLERCTAPDELMMISPNGVLWPGKSPEVASALGQLEWEKVRKGKDFGDYSMGETKYYWVAHDIGHYSVIFAAERWKPAAEPAAQAPSATPGADTPANSPTSLAPEPPPATVETPVASEPAPAVEPQKAPDKSKKKKKTQ